MRTQRAAAAAVRSRHEHNDVGLASDASRAVRFSARPSFEAACGCPGVSRRAISVPRRDHPEDAISRRLRHGRHDGERLAERGVQERRLADVRPADDGDDGAARTLGWLSALLMGDGDGTGWGSTGMGKNQGLWHLGPSGGRSVGRTGQGRDGKAKCAELLLRSPPSHDANKRRRIPRRPGPETLPLASAEAAAAPARGTSPRGLDVRRSLVALALAFVFFCVPIAKSGIWDPFELTVADLSRRIAINVLGAKSLASTAPTTRCRASAISGAASCRSTRSPSASRCSACTSGPGACRSPSGASSAWPASTGFSRAWSIVAPRSTGRSSLRRCPSTSSRRAPCSATSSRWPPSRWPRRGSAWPRSIAALRRARESSAACSAPSGSRRVS